MARASVLVLSGTPPRRQENRGALQDIDHTLLVRSVTRYARTVREPTLLLRELDEAVSRAVGEGSDPGPVYLDFPTDTLRSEVPLAVQLQEHFRPKHKPKLLPEPSSIAVAVETLWSARRPLIISGRGAKEARGELLHMLNRLGAAYVDTGESRGLISDDHPSVINAARSAAIAEADVVVTVGRRLDFQLAYGSPAVFRSAKFVRISDIASELRDNRRGEVEVLASPAHSLAEIVKAAGNRQSSVDRSWVHRLRAAHEERAGKLKKSMHAAAPGNDGLMHPNKLLAALQDKLSPDTIVVTDGGDFLSFARIGLSASTMLDPGAFGCIGIGVPFGIAASLAYPERLVVVATGDGAFGFNAVEIDSAVRHRAPLLIVVANNGAWQIEVHDQQVTYGNVVGTKLQFSNYAQMAQAFGMYGERVENVDHLEGAIERALANRPALLDVLVTPDAISSDAKAGLAWVPDLQALAVWDQAERDWIGD
jgi:acetolactate synthase-1/2/3 large subunit